MRVGCGRRGGRGSVVEVEEAEPTRSLARAYASIFTDAEKKRGLRRQVFRNGRFDGVDFSRADLSYTRFEDVTLSGSNFTRANLRGVTFVRCDLRGSTFERALLGKNHFELALFAGSRGLTNKQREYIQRHGGTFALDGPKRNA